MERRGAAVRSRTVALCMIDWSRLMEAFVKKRGIRRTIAAADLGQASRPFTGPGIVYNMTRCPLTSLKGQLKLLHGTSAGTNHNL